MLLFMALAFADPVVIRFALPPTLSATYQASVSFDGYVPVFGGQQAKVKIELTAGITGAPPDADGNAQVTSEVKEFTLALNDKLLPFSAKSVSGFFPKSTASVALNGHVLKTDAPAKPMPIRLFGLDSQRFPEITYLPVEFPEKGVEEGKSYEYRRRFNGSDVHYVATPTKINDDTVIIAIVLDQAYVSYEDARHNPVSAESGAIQLDTKVNGDGTVTFDRKLGLVAKAEYHADTKTVATDLQTKTTTDRVVHSILKIERRSNP